MGYSFSVIVAYKSHQAHSCLSPAGMGDVVVRVVKVFVMEVGVSEVLGESRAGEEVYLRLVSPLNVCSGCTADPV